MHAAVSVSSAREFATFSRNSMVRSHDPSLFGGRLQGSAVGMKSSGHQQENMEMRSVVKCWRGVIHARQVYAGASGAASG